METAARIMPGELSNVGDLKRPGKDTKIVSGFPAQEKPLIVKLLRDPRSGGTFVQMGYYGYNVGPDPKKHSRSRPSLQSMKKLAADPEKEAFWAIHNQIKELKKTHNENHPDVVALEAKKKLFSARDCGWFYFIEPNSDVIKAIKFPPDAINMLFGKEATKYRPAYVSVLDTLAKQGRSPYDLNNETGWLKLYKTGEGLATRYFVGLDAQQTEVVDANGDVSTKTAANKYAIHSRLLTEGAELSEYPNPIEFEARSAFTLDETITYVDSNGTKIPERFYPGNSTSSDDSPREVSDEVYNNQGALASLDDIPF